jgi:hypothetical protein
LDVVSSSVFSVICAQNFNFSVASKGEFVVWIIFYTPHGCPTTTIVTWGFVVFIVFCASVVLFFGIGIPVQV